MSDKKDITERLERLAGAIRHLRDEAALVLEAKAEIERLRGIVAVGKTVCNCPGGIFLADLERAIRAYEGNTEWKIGDKSWEKVVHDCERDLGCTDRSVSPTMANLPNLIRDLKAEIERLRPDSG